MVNVLLKYSFILLFFLLNEMKTQTDDDVAVLPHYTTHVFKSQNQSGFFSNEWTKDSEGIWIIEYGVGSRFLQQIQPMTSVFPVVHIDLSLLSY